MKIEEEKNVFTLPLIIDNQKQENAIISDYFSYDNELISDKKLTLAYVFNGIIQRRKQKQVKICTGYFSPNVWKLIGNSFSSLPITNENITFQMLIGSELQMDQTDEYQKLFQKLLDDIDSFELDIKLQNHIINLIHFLEREDVEVGIQTSPFVHAKLYCFPNIAIVGSSNFTFNGLTKNTELNLPTTHPETVEALNLWFDRIFSRSDKSYKEKLLNALCDCKLGTREWTPYEVFLKIIFEYHRPSLIKTKKEEMVLNLTEFQQEGVQHLIQIIKEFGGAMLADAVGLGKTYQAIEVMDQLRRSDPTFRIALIICPAQLQENWAKYIDLYGLGAKVYSMERLGREVPRGSYNMFVIDESHNFRNRNIKRYRNLMHLLTRNASAKILLLTATPINTSLDDLYSQFRIITKGVDAYNPLIDIGINDLKEYIKSVKKGEEDILRLKEHAIVTRSRREIRHRQEILKQDLFLPDGTKLAFPKRHLHTASYSLISNGSQEFYENVGELIYDLKFPQYNLNAYQINLTEDEKQKSVINASAMIKILLLKRLESSVPAFQSSIEIQIRLLVLFLDALKKGLVFNTQITRNVMDLVIDGDVDDLTDEEALSFLNELLLKYEKGEIKVSKLFKDTKKSEEQYNFELLTEDISEEITKLQKLLSLCKEIVKETDHKLEALKEIVFNYRKSEITNQKKILIFSYYKDTLQYIHNELKNELETSLKTKVEIIFGGVQSNERTKIVQRFAPKSNIFVELLDEADQEFLEKVKIKPEDEIDVLFSTDVLSEGQNLQDAMILINYDLHWNPVRLIQRIGRVDRLKSPHSDVFIHNFFPEEGLEILLKLVERLENRLKLIDGIIEIDGELLREGDLTEEQQTRRDELKLIKATEESVLDLLEAKVELATLEDSKKHLLNMITKLSYDHFDNIPLGIHSGMKKGKHAGVMVALRVKRKDKLPITLWGFEPDNPEELSDYPMVDNLITNMRLIESKILCDETTPRHLPDDANLRGELFHRVLLISRKLEEKIRVKKVLDKFRQKKLPLGNKKIYDFIKIAIQHQIIKRSYADRLIEFLENNPINNIKQDIEKDLETFNSQMIQISNQLKEKNVKKREETKELMKTVVPRFFENIYKYFDKYNILITNEEDDSSRERKIELIGFLRIYTET